MFSIHDHQALNDFARTHRVEPLALRRLRIAFYKKQQPTETALQKLPSPQRELFEKNVKFHSLILESRYDSKVDGATKLIFKTTRGDCLETVILRIATGRTTLCISSQVGCAAACSFCATGKMGLIANLSTDEILDQVIQANQLLLAEGRQIRNLVWMGMGEPLHNEENVRSAITTLINPQAFNFSPQRLLVSTVGIPAVMMRLARDFPKVHLALSLHSARQEVRDQIVPIGRKYDLAALQRTLSEITVIQNQPVMIEYIMLQGVNDTAQDIDALSQFLKDIPVHINLIPLNSILETAALQPTSKEKREAFGAALRHLGFKVTLRYSLGSDITAACGQLIRQTKRSS